MFDNRENGNHECIRETSEKTFPKLKSQNGAFQLMRCLSGGEWGTTTFTYYSWPRGVHHSTSERIVEVICDICEAPLGGYSS